MGKHVLVTGGAGFIGSHLVERLLEEGHEVTSLDAFDDFYDPWVKRANIARHFEYRGFHLVEADIRDRSALERACRADVDTIVHLAARAGVRPSIAQPALYQDVNVSGTQNLLELARSRGIGQFVFASSSSVYGVNPRVPWREEDAVLLPISPYAGTKVAGELLGHVYSHLYGIRFLALRFFTVYGPRQRPDLAIHTFARRLLAGQPIRLFGDGSTVRDYTYVDDVVDGIVRSIAYEGSSYEVINLGNDRTISLRQLVDTIADVLDVAPLVEHLPEQPGDVPRTWASIDKARRLLGYAPATQLRTGIEQFAEWVADRLDRSTPHYQLPAPGAIAVP